MENASILRVKQSLGFSPRLVWILGVPDFRLRYKWRIIYTLILSVFFLAMHGTSMPSRILILSSISIEDMGPFLAIELFRFIFTYVILILWVTSGAKTMQETISDLARIDLAMKDFHVRQKDPCFRREQIFYTGLLMFGCCTDVSSIIIIKNTFRPSSGSHYTAFHLACLFLFSFQLLTLHILFSAVISVIRHRYKGVNMALYEIGKAHDASSLPKSYSSLDRRSENVLLRNNQPQVTRSRVERLPKDLDVLWEMHKRLGDITETFCGVFLSSLVIAFLIELSACILHVHVIAHMLHQTSKTSSMMLYFNVYGLFYNFIIFSSIVRHCSEIATEANKFGIMLHRINVNDAAFYKKLRELSVKNHQEKLAIVTGGFLRIDYSCLTFIFSTVTAYAVLMYQLIEISDDRLTR